MFRFLRNPTKWGDKKSVELPEAQKLVEEETAEARAARRLARHRRLSEMPFTRVFWIRHGGVVFNVPKPLLTYVPASGDPAFWVCDGVMPVAYKDVYWAFSLDEVSASGSTKELAYRSYLNHVYNIAANEGWEVLDHPGDIK